MKYYIAKKHNMRKTIIAENLDLKSAISLWAFMNPFYIFDEEGKVVYPFNAQAEPINE